MYITRSKKELFSRAKTHVFFRITKVTTTARDGHRFCKRANFFVNNVVVQKKKTIEE